MNRSPRWSRARSRARRSATPSSITICTSSAPSSGNSTPRSPTGSGGGTSNKHEGGPVIPSREDGEESPGNDDARRTCEGDPSHSAVLGMTGAHMRLANKVALITGGGSGIGKASCIAFAREGAQVVVVDVKLQTAEATAKEVGGAAFAADVSKAKDAEAMVKFAEETF